MFTEKMRHLVAVVLEPDADKITQELLRLGVLHAVNITEIDPELSAQVEQLSSPVTETTITELRKRVDSFLDMIGEVAHAQDNLSIESLEPLDLKKANKTLNSIADSLQAIRDEQQDIQQQLMKFADIRRQLTLFGNLGAGLQANSRYSFLNLQTGSVRSSMLEPLQEALKITPTVLMNLSQDIDQTNMLLISMKKDESTINKILDKFAWVDVELSHENMAGDTGNTIDELDTKLDTLRNRQEELSKQAMAFLEEKKPLLLELWKSLRINELCARLRAAYSRTARTVIISGWVPAAAGVKLEDGIRRLTAGRCYLEWHDAKEMPDHVREHIPVHLNSPRWLRPFEMLVRNYSLPEYGTVNPTPFVTVAYLMMFGLMFGDAGHGAVLLLVGVIGTAAFTDRQKGMGNLMRLISWCGGAAIFAGILFGSWFGEQWTTPLWMDYHGIVTGHATAETGRDVYHILSITIYFGIAVIGLGLLLNWINLIVKRHWYKLVFDKAGLVGAWIYGVGIYTAFHFVESNYKELPGADSMILCFGIPSLLMGLNPVLHFVRHRDGKPLGFAMLMHLFIEWMVELLEVFAGYLANTLSFMRVAGLGIAHVYLMVALASIADMLRNETGSYTLAAYLLVIVGHAGIIALEGLSAGIQSLRLNYYEFFSKYFSGSGLAYSPVSLRSSL